MLVYVGRLLPKRTRAAAGTLLTEADSGAINYIFLYSAEKL